MNNKPYEITLRGNIIAKAKIGLKDKDMFDRVVILKTQVEVDGMWHPDMQFDAYCWHDEGMADFDIEECRPCYDDEFEIINANGKLIENKNCVIKEIIEIFDEDLEVQDI